MGSGSFASAKVDVVATPARLWEVLVDLERWPDWTPTVTSVERLDPGPLAIGSRTRLVQPRLRPAVWKVTELDQAKGVFVWKARSPGITITGCHFVIATTLGCRVTVSIEFSGLFAPIARLTMGKLTREYVHTEAESLKLHSESWRRPAVSEQGRKTLRD